MLYRELKRSSANRQALMSCASVSFCQQSMCWRVVLLLLYSSANRTKVVSLRHNLTPLSHLGTIWHHLASGVDRNWINICELHNFLPTFITLQLSWEDPSKPIYVWPSLLQLLIKTNLPQKRNNYKSFCVPVLEKYEEVSTFPNEKPPSHLLPPILSQL